MDIEELREIFDQFDSDSNGAIDFDEFNELLDALDSGIEPMGRQVGFDVIDTDGNGTIEFSEFCVWWQENDE